MHIWWETVKMFKMFGLSLLILKNTASFSVWVTSVTGLEPFIKENGIFLLELVHCFLRVVFGPFRRIEMLWSSLLLPLWIQVSGQMSPLKFIQLKRSYSNQVPCLILSSRLGVDFGRNLIPDGISATWMGPIGNNEVVLLVGE